MSIEALKTCYTPGWFIETFGGKFREGSLKEQETIDWDYRAFLLPALKKG